MILVPYVHSGWQIGFSMTFKFSRNTSNRSPNFESLRDIEKPQATRVSRFIRDEAQAKLSSTLKTPAIFSVFKLSLRHREMIHWQPFIMSRLVTAPFSESGPGAADSESAPAKCNLSLRPGGANLTRTRKVSESSLLVVTAVSRRAGESLTRTWWSYLLWLGMARRTSKVGHHWQGGCIRVGISRVGSHKIKRQRDYFPF